MWRFFLCLKTYALLYLLVFMIYTHNNKWLYYKKVTTNKNCCNFEFQIFYIKPMNKDRIVVISVNDSHIASCKTYPGAIGYGKTQKGAMADLKSVVCWAKKHNIYTAPVKETSDFRIKTMQYQLC